VVSLAILRTKLHKKLFRRVCKDVGLCNRSAIEVVGPEGCSVRNRTPVVRQLPTVIAELEERVDDLHGAFGHSRFELGVILRGIEYREHLSVTRLLARQRRRVDTQ
jgi:hypothetical protein